MSISDPFMLRPLSLAISLASLLPAVLFSHTALGANIPVKGVLNIDQFSAANNYIVTEGGTLNVKGGTQHGSVRVETSTLTMAAGSAIQSADLSFGASLTMAGSTVRNGLSFNESQGTIVGSTLVNNTGNGLSVARRPQDTFGSSVSLTDSTSTGVTNGALVTHFSQLDLQNSHLVGNGANGLGLRLVAGVAKASGGSSLTGTVNGVLIVGEQFYQEGSLTLDDSHVTGEKGAAIRVAPSSPTSSLPIAVINVNNGSTLTGGNGNILESASGADATLNVNASHLTGNVQVDASSAATLNLSQSSLTGDVVAESGGTASVQLDNGSLLIGRLENTRSVAINDGSQWTMVDNASVENLTMNGGVVQLGDPAAFYTLSVANLSGSGTFKMDVDFGAAQTDYIDITGSATGSHQLLIGSTGSDPTTDTSLHVVHAEAGDASFSLVGGRVDLGTWSYDLIKKDENDWYLDATTRTIGPAPQTILALFNAAPTVWYGELSSLRTRMGELRVNGGRSGVWMRTYGNKFNVANASGFGYKQVQQGTALGADGNIPAASGQWLAGVMVGQSTSDLSLDRGASGKVDSYYVGAYSTWLDSESGYYLDGVVKLNRFQNKARVNLSDGTRTKGDYSNSGVGASVEFGRHIKLDNSYYVEPYAQLIGAFIEGKDYSLDNGMRAEGDPTRSLLGKVGVTSGRDFHLGQGRTVQPYVRVALAHEFVKHNEVKINDNRFDNNVSGARGEVGTGVAVAFSDRLEAHVDFEYSNGSKIEQPWGANVGLRYNW
ncbi:autotransporter outer membrane beta-barrel domain-containing protein [Pseudomonas asturiensis]|uniref:Autotransporter outer membrane beta-barrel domain-containing protein n=1 Tax=Pseudomonas asturiensis TaxID=1190415 RepID=A0ABX6HEJ2_9PSED|nr:autotransporter outer membrane beta-barrel domain-containing protein [Pseudomonas asturiensis]QHF03975.1 autotransporter outer membrane beta-barrel domain-containing protein [Pseudomonas asturiensis]